MPFHRETNKKVAFPGSPLFALLFFFILWFGLTFFSGALFSGYHITDDHEIISIHNDFKNHAPFLTVLKREIVNDFSIRFRPLYYIERVLTIKAFGDDFQIFSVYRMLSAVFTSFLLFLFARNFGMDIRESFLFPFLSLVGAQSSAWLLRGPAEALATLLFAFSLYCINVSEKLPRMFSSIAFAVSCAAMSLTKENYTLTIPFFCALAAYSDKSRTNMPWKTCIKMRRGVYAFLGCFLVADLAVIKFAVGTNQIGYAGIQVNALKYATTILEFIFYNGEGIVCAVCMFLFARFYKDHGKKSILLLCGFLAFLALQTFVYAKSGLLTGQGRYVLPSSITFSFMTCLLLTFFRSHPKELSGKENLQWKSILLFSAFLICIFNVFALFSDQVSSLILSAVAKLKGHSPSSHWFSLLHLFSLRFAIIAAIASFGLIISWKSRQLYSLAMTIVIVTLCYCAMSAFGAGLKFSKEGKNIRQCMEAIDRFDTDSSRIVIVADPAWNVEDVFSVTRYLTIKAGKKNIRYWFFDAHLNDRMAMQQWKDTTLRHFETQSIHTGKSLDSAQCLFFLKGTEQPFFALTNDGLQKDFIRNKWGDLVCYFHK